MNTNEAKKLDYLLRNMPQNQGDLTQNFKDTLMARIVKEAEKQKKSRERIALLSTVAASIGIIAIAVCTILLSGIKMPEVKIPQFNYTTLSFYSYIGGLALILLGIDHLFCKAYRKKHGGEGIAQH
jgi:fumarate reductase subunit D